MSTTAHITLEEDDGYCYPNWTTLPDVLVIHIFTFLNAKSLCRASLACKSWLRLAFDELLWKDLFHRHWKIHRSMPLAPEKHSWVQEYKRLLYHTPVVESEVFKVHTDEVLHVSFSHNGKMFATTSKDSSVKVWNLSYPTSLRYEADMTSYYSQHTAISEFSLSDSLLLVSGQRRVFPTLNLSGYIVFFSLGETLVLLKCMMTSPFETFGYWYNEHYILHGIQKKTTQQECSSQFFLSTAAEKSTAEKETLTAKLFKFKDRKPSLVRKLITVYDLNQQCKTDSISQNDQDTFAETKEILTDERSQIKEQNEKRSSNHVQVKQKCENDDLSDRFACLELDNDAAEKNTASAECQHEVIKSTNGNANQKDTKGTTLAEGIGRTQLNKQRNVSDQNPEKVQANKMRNPLNSSRNDVFTDTYPNEQHSNLHTDLDNHKNLQNDKTKQIDKNLQNDKTKQIDLRAEEKGIIFTTGTKERTPHQIGIKKVNYLPENGALVSDDDDNSNENGNYDETDYLFEIGGHINGLRLSPEHRYLFVNSRAWPENYHTEDPLDPPSISEDITVHVIDLVKMQNLGVMYSGHKGYSPNRGCFFIYVDVHDDYVASGSEDKQGYLWDRHYGVCLQKFPHDDIVNCVAFNPVDPEVLVTVSDDWSIKIWRSINRQRHTVNNQNKGSRIEQHDRKLEVSC